MEAKPKEIQEKIHIDRIIGQLKGKPGPTCLFFGGVHGNEPSGVLALQEVFEEISSKNSEICGSFYAIGGNLGALANGERYHESDLNRLWTEKRMTQVEKGQFNAENEDEKEMLEIFELVEDILDKESGPFYFFDLHTTSSKTSPFITVNDSLLNRKFTKLFPIPLILGIEEYLDGPMLSYYNEKGFVSFGFEGGEHYHKASIQNHKDFIYLSLVFTGLLEKNESDFQASYSRLDSQSAGMSHFYEIYERFAIKDGDHFEMRNGYTNFQKVKKGEVVATYNGAEQSIDDHSMIFMPLYQSRGNDGYFLIRKTPEFFLGLSKLVRKMRLDRVLPILPGILWMSIRKEKMLVDLNIARFLTKPLLHLMGYRAKEIEGEALIIKNREANSRASDYKKEKWY